MKKIKELFFHYHVSIISFIMMLITLYISIINYYGGFDDWLMIIIFILSLLPSVCFLVITVYSILSKKKKMRIWFLVLAFVWSFLYYYLFLFLSVMVVFVGSFSCTKDLLQTVESPNGEYVVNTYQKNCHATTDFSVIGELCNKNNECKRIYNCYHEKDSFVYWIDNETVFINNKELNIFDDEYDWGNDNNYQDKLYKK